MDWPQGGTFNLDTILQVEEKVCQPDPYDHADQVPYIVTWESLSREPSYSGSKHFVTEQDAGTVAGLHRHHGRKGSPGESSPRATAKFPERGASAIGSSLL